MALSEESRFILSIMLFDGEEALCAGTLTRRAGWEGALSSFLWWRLSGRSVKLNSVCNNDLLRVALAIGCPACPARSCLFLLDLSLFQGSTFTGLFSKSILLMSQRDRVVLTVVSTPKLVPKLNGMPGARGLRRAVSE